MVLLHLLYRLAPEQGWRLSIAHFNHQLRGRSSDADERLVRRTAAKLHLPIQVERVRVSVVAKELGLSIEMAARRVRHEFLARAAAGAGCDTVALAHHADDQLELFFLRLLRGSGSDGLLGMKWCNRSPANTAIRLVRPLLDVSKVQIKNYAAAAKVAFREDATNASLEIQRNRIRHELLPLLRRRYQPALDKTIQRTIELVGAEADYAVQMAQEWLFKVRSAERGARNKKTGGAGGKVKLETGGDSGDVAAFNQLPVALQRRVIQLQLWELHLAAEYDFIEELRRNADKPINMACRPGASRSPVVSRDVLGLVRLQEPELLEFRSESLELDLKGRTGQTRFGGRLIRWQLAPAGTLKDFVQVAGQEVFDADKVGSRIVLRHWQAGDRFQPSGMVRAVKVQDLFVNQRIARARRHEIIVAATERGEVFWVEGLRISESFKLTSETKRWLRWRWQRL